MAQDQGQTLQSRPAPRKKMSDFVKAFIWTAVPLAVVSIASTVTTATATGGGGFAIGVGVGGLLFAAAIVVSIAFAIARKRQIATGVLAGAAIGLVGLMLTCFILSSKPATSP